MWAISRDERERGRNGETGEEAKSHRTAIGKCTERSRSRTRLLAEDHDDDDHDVEAKSHRKAIGKCTERSRSRTRSLAEDHDDGAKLLADEIAETAETKGWNRRGLVVLQMKLGKSGDDVTRQQEARIIKVKRRIEELERELRLLKRDLAERVAASLGL